MNSLAKQNVLLGVTGGIAAYKTPDLVRRLREQGANVRVIMTPAATQFITPLSLEAVSEHPVHQDLSDTHTETAMSHIDLARWADLLLVAPATANTMANFIHGQAHDLLSTVYLATTATVALAPAMNQQMWEHSATQHNLQTLKDRGGFILGPGTGSQACGEIGPGRMLEPSALCEQLNQLASKLQEGQVHVMITAGPTQESLDPVRFLSNHSTGKMGYALARAAQREGAKVTLISGPTNLNAPLHVKRLSVKTAHDMLDSVLQHLPQVDIFIGCAAVADYCYHQTATEKMKKNAQALTLTLEPTPDIIKTVTKQNNKPFTVGFCAESHNLIESAQQKLTDKKLDMIAANWIGKDEIGFASDENALTVLWKNEQIEFEQQPKVELAEKLLTLILDRYHAT